MRCPGGGSAAALFARASLDRRRERGDVVEVEVLFRQVGEPIEATRQVVMLAGLDKAEVPLGQADGVVARQRAHDRYAELRDRIGHQPAMALAPDAVEHDAADADCRIVRTEPPHHRGRGLRLRRYVEHEQHGESKSGGEVSRRAGAAARTGHAVEQPHDAFDDQQFAVPGGLGEEPVEERGRHCPGIEIETTDAGGCGMKGRIDVIGAGLGGAHGDPPSFQRGEKPECDRGLARSRARSRDDQAARGHRAPSLSAMTRASSRSCRTFTIFPTTMIEGVPNA